MRLRITRSAKRDLDEIFVYWAQRASLEVADRLTDAILERIALLAERPMIGRKCEEITPGVRCFPAGKFLIYYRKTRTAVEILHIFHGAMEQKKAFLKG
jgi:toxin ParE1/3/4